MGSGRAIDHVVLTVVSRPNRPPSDRGGDLVARLADGALGVDPEQEEHAQDEEDDERDDRGPVGAGELEDDTEQERAEPGGAAFAGVVQAEVLALAAAGATADFGVELWEHTGNVITAMQGIAADLGLDGGGGPVQPGNATGE